MIPAAADACAHVMTMPEAIVHVADGAGMVLVILILAFFFLR